MEAIHDRLLGKLALDSASRVEGVLIAQLASKEILYSHNIEQPEQAATSALALLKSSVALRGAKAVPPFLIRMEGAPSTGTADGTTAYSVIYSDETYLLYADIQSW